MYSWHRVANVLFVGESAEHVTCAGYIDTNQLLHAPFMASHTHVFAACSLAGIIVFGSVMSLQSRLHLLVSVTQKRPQMR